MLADYSPLHRRAEFLIGIFSESKRHAAHAIEASLLILDLAFNHYQLNKLYAFAYGYNEYSQKIMENFGFVREGLLQDHHYSISDQRFIDLYQNGMTERNFRVSHKLSLLSTRLLDRNITQAVKYVTVTPEMEISGLDSIPPGFFKAPTTPIGVVD